jgi:hypothetical protein
MFTKKPPHKIFNLDTNLCTKSSETAIWKPKSTPFNCLSWIFSQSCPFGIGQEIIQEFSRVELANFVLNGWSHSSPPREPSLLNSDTGPSAQPHPRLPSYYRVWCHPLCPTPSHRHSSSISPLFWCTAVTSFYQHPRAASCAGPLRASGRRQNAARQQCPGPIPRGLALSTAGHTNFHPKTWPHRFPSKNSRVV